MAENLQGFCTQARRRFLDFTRNIRQYWLYGTYYEWKCHKSEGKGDAQGGVGDLETQIRCKLTDQTGRGVQRRQRNTGHCRGQCERQVDHCIDHFSSREGIAH
ncbi:hypothetical protein D3C78_1388820 [compost metagenome]